VAAERAATRAERGAQIQSARAEIDRLAAEIAQAASQCAKYAADADAARSAVADREALVGQHAAQVAVQREIAAAAQVRASNVKMVIIDPPQVPQVPVAPARILLSIGVLITGLAAGVGVVIAMMTLDTSFHSIVDLRAMGRPVLGAISLAALPPTLAMRLRSAAIFGSAIGGLVVVLGGVLLHYSQRI